MLKYISDPVEGMDGLRPFTGSAVKITIHTTETAIKPNWQEKRKGLPHYTLDGTTVYSHLPLDMAAYTLIGGDNSPNSDAGVHIQIEWVGFAENTPNRSDDDYAALAELLTDISEKIGCPWVFPFKFTGSNGWGPSGVVRQTWDDYKDVSGIMGHSHAPYNNHWDPGMLDVERLTLLRPQPECVDYEKIEAIVTEQVRVDEVLSAVQEATAKIDILQTTVEDIKETLLNLRLVVDK